MSAHGNGRHDGAQGAGGAYTREAGWFPAASVAGPRQSGKSTPVRSAFQDHAYVNLEGPQVRREALEDPAGFVRNRPARLVIDERDTPRAVPAVQAASDESMETGPPEAYRPIL